MPPLMLIIIMIAGVVILVAVGSFSARRRSLFTEEEFKESKYPFGYYKSVGMTACIALGILAGLAMNNVPIGAAIGIGFGLIVGQFLEKRFNSDAGPFTEEEKRERLNRKRVGLIAMFILVFFTLASAVLSLTR